MLRGKNKYTGNTFPLCLPISAFLYKCDMLKTNTFKGFRIMLVKATSQVAILQKCQVKASNTS